MPKGGPTFNDPLSHITEVYRCAVEKWEKVDITSYYAKFEKCASEMKTFCVVKPESGKKDLFVKAFRKAGFTVNEETEYCQRDGDYNTGNIVVSGWEK